MKAWLNDPLNYFWGDQRKPEASSCKYLGIILCSNLSWADQVNYAVQKAWKALHFIMHILKKGNNNMRSLVYMSLEFLILQYAASCWDLNREGPINACDCVLKKAPKFANHTKDLVWETLVQCRKIARICTLFIAYTREWAWKSTGGRLKGPCYLSRNDHNHKIRARKQRTGIGKYSPVNRTIKLWNQLPAEALAIFPCKSHIFRKRVRKVIISEVRRSEGFCKRGDKMSKSEGELKIGNEVLRSAVQ